MRDALGWRRKFGVIGPSTNTVVQPDFDAMRPRGVTNHYARILTPNIDTLSNATFRAGVATISANVTDAIESVMTCQPDYLVMAMSAITFFGGAKGADAFVRQAEELAGVCISVGSHAAAAALRAYGGIERVAGLSPPLPVINEEGGPHFGGMGLHGARGTALPWQSWI